MKPRTLAVGLVAALLLASATAYGSADRLGSAGAQELRIPVGAREVAIGGAVVADAAGAAALFWNPAGAGNTVNTEILFSHQPYIADMNVEYVAVNTPTGIGTIGASVKVLSVGEMLVTTEAAPEGTGETTSPTMSVLGLTYSRAMTDRVLFGVTAMYVNETILRESAKGVAFDFGFQYHPGWRGLKLGLVMKNFGPGLTFDGPDFERILLPADQDPQSRGRTFKTQTAPCELPSSFEFGATWEQTLSPLSRVLVASAFQSNNFSDDEVRVGAEYGYRDLLFVRGSYVYTAQDDYLFNKGAVGIGVRVPMGASDAFLDYAYVPVRDWFDDVHHLTVRFQF
jgi:hypothetical protein